MVDREEELLQLKEFFVEIGWIGGLFQILFLLEDVKIGVWLQENRRKKLINMNDKRLIMGFIQILEMLPTELPNNILKDERLLESFL